MDKRVLCNHFNKKGSEVFLLEKGVKYKNLADNGVNNTKTVTVFGKTSCFL